MSRRTIPKKHHDAHVPGLRPQQACLFRRSLNDVHVTMVHGPDMVPGTNPKECARRENGRRGDG